MAPIVTADQSLDRDIAVVLKDVQQRRTNPLTKDHTYLDTLETGLRVLARRAPHTDTQVWRDAIAYARDVIVNPRDDSSRPTEVWARSCSDLAGEFMSRFGPSTVEAAREGCQRLLEEHFGGDGRRIPHVEKKASFFRHYKDQRIANACYPSDSILAVMAYEVGFTSCALTMLAWANPKVAIGVSYISALSLCDDYAAFTETEYNVRLRMVALAMGGAFECGGRAAHAIIGGSLLQSQGVGTSKDRSIDSIMAWRAISGCSSPNSGYTVGVGSIDEGTISPRVMMVIHDIYDYRADVAGGNHENGVIATYGLGEQDPFHVYLEALLRLSVSGPLASIYAISATTIMHFTSARYGTYDYKVKGDTKKSPCESCIRLLREATAGAGFEWAPEAPPSSFAEGDEVRKQAKDLFDNFRGSELIQTGIGWFQHLILTGGIWRFDVLTEGVGAVDTENEWV